MDSEIAPNSWRSSAAYLYILELDEVELAWEYVRRNPQRQRIAADQTASQVDEDSRLGGSKERAHDTCELNPEALADLASALTVTRSPPTTDSTRFSIWRIAGHKSLTRKIGGWILTVRDGVQSRRLFLADALSDEEPFSFQIPGGKDPERYLPLMSRINAWMIPERRQKCGHAARSFRPNREALLHMRTLQAMDGEAAGASHKETAEALFGADDVWQRWGKDSELRSQIRRLLRRGHVLSNGGYRHLLTHSRSSRTQAR